MESSCSTCDWVSLSTNATSKGRNSPQVCIATQERHIASSEAQMLESQLLVELELSLSQFRRIHNISPKYMWSLISSNCHNPSIKAAVMNRYVTKTSNHTGDYESPWSWQVMKTGFQKKNIELKIQVLKSKKSRNHLRCELWKTDGISNSTW
jgi:hypothetical protein